MGKVALTLDVDFDSEVVVLNIKKLLNKVYKLLPMRQQGRDWEKLLETLIEELSGMKRLIVGQDDLFFLILCKLEGLFSLSGYQDMAIFRRTIFECLNLLGSLCCYVSNQ